VGSKSRYARWLAALLLVEGLGFSYPVVAHAQRHDEHPRDESTPTYGSGGSSNKLPVPEPYGGQIYCPVTGAKLGLTHPPVAVQTAIGEQKPSWFGKMFGDKVKPGAVIYVCCPACVEKVRANPERYLEEIIADKGCFTFTYARAPAQRPPRGEIDANNPPRDLNPVTQGSASPVVTRSGLKYQDLKVGEGEVAKEGDFVKVHYTGSLQDGTKFDSSLDRGEPLTFRVGVAQVIKGWDEGVMGMRVGGKRKLFIPPELGYGERGSPPAIPANSNLVFEVELLGIR
jgi:peptidylprolyl isomerase